MANTFEILKSSGRAISIESFAAGLNVEELSWLATRTTGHRSDVPDFVNFLNALAVWELARRAGRTCPFPSIQALVNGFDLYCDDAMDDFYVHLFQGLDERCAIDDLLDAICLIDSVLKTLANQRVTQH